MVELFMALQVCEVIRDPLLSELLPAQKLFASASMLAKK
jgi:hypothetical protein